MDNRQIAAPGKVGGRDPMVDAVAGSTVMVIDDDVITLEVMREFLVEVGYRNVVVVAEAAEALERIHSIRPDVVLLDLVMPEVSGFDILRAMREDLRYIPVIILTAISDSETKLQAFELGATDLLAKPVDPSELVLRLRNTLAFKAHRDHLAHSDSLTDLPNRGWFIGDLKQALGKRQGLEQMLALLHVDLDQFKHINDSLGHGVGDILLKAVASRFSSAVRAAEQLPEFELASRPVLARFSGDEFVVLMSELRDPELAARLAKHLLESLAQPFHVGKHELFLTASIGIAVSPQDGDDIVSVLKHSEIAMHAAKQQGRNIYRYYSPELNALALERLTLESRLRRAVERRELVLHYQPQVEVATGRIIGVEALMRWQHPELGLIMPGRFIPVAEDIDLMHEMGEWALFEACRQAKEWERAGFDDIVMSVNASTPQFRRATFVSTVRRALESSGLAPERLIIEVTESLMISQSEEMIALLHEIKALGVGLSLDDFGTGYSSFSYLKTLPLDEMKIDRSFVADMTTSQQSAAIVAAIVTLAEVLGLKVIVEGVETEAQLAYLTSRGCRYYQGYHHSRPMPAGQLAEKWLGPQANGQVGRSSTVT